MQQVYEIAQDDIALKRYFASVSMAHPEALMGWGKDAVQCSPLSGAEFAALECANWSAELNLLEELG